MKLSHLLHSIWHRKSEEPELMRTGDPFRLSFDREDCLG